jgi:cysteinyl-tRNA synthetase
MDDDFNTPVALGAMFDLAREINRQREENADLAAQLGRLLIKLGGVLGFLQGSPETFLQGHDDDEVDAAHIESLIKQRREARVNKDFALADEIRDKLAALKVVVEDSADGSTWRIER